MPISRFDNPVQRDWRFQQPIIPKLPELNYEALSGLLGQQQAQTDLIQSISEKIPNVLQTKEDLSLYQNYKNMVDSGLQKVSAAYVNDGAQGGTRAYNEYINNVKNAWRPQGQAAILEDRYNSYQNAVKAIDEQYKSDASPVNKTLALNELHQQLSQPIDIGGGRYRQIQTPTLYKDPELRKAINEMVKEIDDSGDTHFLGDTNKDWWLTKIKTAGKPEDKIKAAYEALSQQPEFASQIQRDAQYKALQTNPLQYQAQFEGRVDNNLGKIQSAYTSASQGKGTREWQQTLAQQGYDVPVNGKFDSTTKKASDEFMTQQKQLAKQKKDSFDINKELTNDVNQSYQNYALGFANQKTEKDLIFNKAKDALLKNQRAKERNDALFSISDQLTQAKAPTAVVTSGVAQKLPEINKHYDDLTQQRDGFKAQLDKSFQDPNSTFHGWKFEDVAQAHNIWEQTVKSLPQGSTPEQVKAAYAANLNHNSSYQFTPDNVNKLYQQMNSFDGGIKNSIKVYQDTQDQVERLDNARQHVATQYIDTPEGKSNLEILRKNSPSEYKGLSDQDLVKKAFDDPKAFNLTSQERAGYGGVTFGTGVQKSIGSAADVFIQRMQSDVKDQEKGGKFKYDWGDMATSQTSFTAEDKSFKPVGDAIGNALTNGTQHQFSSEGKSGLTFRDGQGDVVKNIDSIDAKNFVIAKNSTGQPVLNYSARVKTTDGKTKDASVSIDLVPGSPETEQVMTGLKQAYIAEYNAGNTNSANAILDQYNSLQDQSSSLSDAGTQVQVNALDQTKVKPLDDVMWKDIKGNPVPASHLGLKGTDTKNSYNIIDPKTGANLHYETYGILDANGNKKVANVFVAPDNSKHIKSIHSTMSGVRQERTGDWIRANTPVEREVKKLPKGYLPGITQNSE